MDNNSWNIVLYKCIYLFICLFEMASTELAHNLFSVFFQHVRIPFCQSMHYPVSFTCWRIIQTLSVMTTRPWFSSESKLHVFPCYHSTTNVCENTLDDVLIIQEFLCQKLQLILKLQWNCTVRPVYCGPKNRTHFSI